MKTLTAAFTSLFVLALLVLSGGSLLVAHAATSSNSANSLPQQASHRSQSQELSLGLQEGIILSAQNQVWKLSGGSLLGAQFGQQLVESANLHYSMTAYVNGLSASGSFQLWLGGQTITGQSIRVSATGSIVGMVASICFPYYDTPATGTCASGDTSAIPAFFEAAVMMSETGGSTTTTQPMVFLIEAPIMNPWGAPLVISSTDGSVSIMATYSSGTAFWNGVDLTGALSGTLNEQTVSGTLYQVAYAYENFITGTENEFGTVAFQGMTISSLDAQGSYQGTSTVPFAGSYDCSALAGLPEGSCTETGLSSTGTFQMFGGSTSISGNYAVTWPAPSVTCWGTINAIVTS